MKNASVNKNNFANDDAYFVVQELEKPNLLDFCNDDVYLSAIKNK